MLSDIRKLRCVTNCNRLIESSVQYGFFCPPSSLSPPFSPEGHRTLRFEWLAKGRNTSNKIWKVAKFLFLLPFIHFLEQMPDVSNPLTIDWKLTVIYGEKPTWSQSKAGWWITEIKLILSIKWCYFHTKLQFA